MACNDQTGEISHPGDENCNQEESNDAPQTSDELNLPETANNMNDLKTIDFNSADEVRQSIKRVLAGSGPHFEENAVDYIAVDEGDQEQQKKKLQLHLMSKLTETDGLKLISSGHNVISETVKPKTPRLSKNNNSKTSKKRPGRPPKAGPSKKLNKQKYSSLYWGKLSNVVFLKRKERT